MKCFGFVDGLYVFCECIGVGKGVIVFYIKVLLVCYMYISVGVKECIR